MLNIMFIVLAHLLVIYSLFNNGVQQRDWLNPINIILLIGMVRFSLPLLLLQFGSPSIEMFQKMNIGQGENWRHANILALVGLLGVAAGWNITIRPWRKACPHRRELPKSVAYLAVTGMLAGAIFLSVFIESNSTLEEAILTGSFRGTDIQAGTGKYFHLGLMLISCSVILSSYLIKRGNVSYMVALLPVLIATIFYFILGGRTRAITPLIAGLLVIWYERENSTFTAKNTFVLFILFLGLLMFYSGSVLYRARLGLEGFAHGLSFIGLVQYLSTAIWMEIGQLHALAGSLLVGPGVLGGLTFTKLLWPISEFLNIPGNSTGIYLAETLVYHSIRSRCIFPVEAARVTDKKIIMMKQNMIVRK
ncbi:MAG: hypothetical protein IPK65_09430 [Gammaproteobacteria bacterium]|nr:hypothetical protein [Gammaproteobacteria bacterium]